MNVICMDQSAAKKSVPLAPVNSRRIKDKIVFDPLVCKSWNGNCCGNDDDDQRDRKFFHNLKIQSKVGFYL
jgi:hypothetical protein